MTNNDKTSLAGTKTWIRVLLVVSLALNLLVIGIVGGAMFARSKWQGYHSPGVELAGGPLTHALDRADRRAIWREMRKVHRDDRAAQADRIADFEGLIADLKATPFEAEAVRTRLAQHRGMLNDRLELGQTLLLQRITQMDASERASYADRLRETLKHRSYHKKRRD